MAGKISMTVGRIYANALFELARERGAVQVVYDALMGLDELYRGDATFRQAFTDPQLETAQKKDLVDRLFGSTGVQPLPELVRNLLHVLIAKGREAALDNIAAAFADYRDRAENVMHAFVRSPEPLSDGLRARVQDLLGRMTGKSIVIESQVDPELIGGWVVRVGDLLVDTSLRTRFRKLYQHLFSHEDLLLG